MNPATTVNNHSNQKFNFTTEHRWDLIGTVVFSILFIVSSSLTIHFCRNLSQHVIHLTDRFSLSLPVLICSSVGVVSLIIVAVQACRGNKVKKAFGKAAVNLIIHSPRLQKFIRNQLFRGVQKSGWVLQSTHSWVVQSLRYSCRFYNMDTGCTDASTGMPISEPAGLVDMPARDGTIVKGYLNLYHIPNAPTIIYFHGNGQTADSCGFIMNYYTQQGFNVLIPEYRGYGQSKVKGGGPNQELEAYIDAEAAYDFVKSRFPGTKIIAHGYSIGGIYATALGFFFKDISGVICDHTFPSLGAVFSHQMPNSEDGQTVVDGLFSKSVSAIPGKPTLTCDGFNLVAKVEKMEAPLLVIQGEKDHLMPCSFGETLIRSKYSDPILHACYFRLVPGGHSYNWKKEKGLNEKIVSFCWSPGNFVTVVNEINKMKADLAQMAHNMRPLYS